MPVQLNMNELTPRQKAILSFILESTEKYGFPPTLREIGSQFDINSTNGVSEHLKALTRKGFLERGERISRALIPTEKALRKLKGDNFHQIHTSSYSQDMIEVPIIGKIAAGEPFLAQENIVDNVQIDSFFLGGIKKRIFGLRVVGDSMIEDGIFNGDYVFVKKQLHAERGDIVVAMIEGEATLKRYYPEKDSIRFQPANSNIPPIIVKKSEFKSTHILGVVSGVYRKLQ